MSNFLPELKAPEIQALEPSKAKQLQAAFAPMIKAIEAFESRYNEILLKSEGGVDAQLTAEARKLRLEMRKQRVAVANEHKKQKAEYLRTGKAIDAIKNLYTFAVSDKEERLLQVEKFFEIQEEKRLEALHAERAIELAEFVDDPSEINLASMDEDVWAAYLAAKKKAFFDKKAAEEAAEAAAAEAKRLEKVHQDRLEQILPYWNFIPQDTNRSNFSTLSGEQWEELFEKAVAAKDEADKKAEADRVAAEKIKKALAAEEKKRKDAEMKLKAHQEEEAARIKAEEEKALAASNLDDEKKIDALIEDLKALSSKYSFKSKKAQSLWANVIILLNKVIAYVESKK